MIGRRELMAMAASGALMPGSAFAAERRVFKAKIVLEDNRVLVAVGMNGQGPYIFMIDTGSYLTMIRPDLAKQLKLPIQSVEHSSGVGGRGAYNLYLANNFVIGGGIRQAKVVLSDAFTFGYRQEIYGALAAGIVTAVDTDLDFDAGELRIYPDGHGERPGYVAIDSVVPRAELGEGSRRIVATILLDGRPLRCMLDTGSPRNLLLNQTAARRLGLWDGRPYAPSRPNGIGGTAPLARTIRAGSIVIGGVTADRPLITMLGDDVAAEGGSELDGIVGLSFIRRFNLSIDTRAHKLWVQPNTQTAPPERYGLSGLYLDKAGSGMVVVAVGTGSPGAAAGIAAGDRIVDTSWDDALSAIGAGPGKTVKLKVERGGARREVDFTLREFL